MTPEQIFRYIEGQTHRLEYQRRRALGVLVEGHVTADQEPAITYASLERDAEAWASEIPDDPNVLADIAHLIATTYGLYPSLMPGVFVTLRLDHEAVRNAYANRFTQPIETLFVEESPTTEDASEAILGVMRPVHMNSGDVLFRQGDAANDGVYVIISGRVRVAVRDVDGNEKTVAECGRDTVIGEMALLTDDLRTATVTAIRDTELYRISRETFEKLVYNNPRIMLQISRMIVKRVGENARVGRVQGTINTIGVIPAGRGVDISAFTRLLTTYLETHGNAAHIRHSSLPDSLVHDDSILMRWLNAQEESFDFLIYEADSELTEWTRLCIRQADRLILVGQADGNKILNEIERELFQTDAFNPSIHKEMVLLHRDVSTPPSHTYDWLANRPVDDYHHVIPDKPEHMQRLVRFVLGKTTAVVLSSGGTRAFAHIGALRAMKDTGLPIDFIGGTSAGALVGALVAMGHNLDEIENLTLAMIQRSRSLIDFTFPFTSILGGRRFGEHLHGLFGDLTIEDLWVKYFCTSVDMTEAQQLVHRRGLLHHYVRASCSIPAVLPPVIDDNRHLLADGMLISSIPVYPMKEISPDSSLIVVDVTNVFYGADEDYNYGGDLPFWKVIRGRVNPFGRRLVIPSIYNVLLRSFELSSVSMKQPQIDLADLYIRPPVKPIGLRDVTGARELIQIGYHEACQQLELFAQPAVL